MISTRKVIEEINAQAHADAFMAGFYAGLELGGEEEPEIEELYSQEYIDELEERHEKTGFIMFLLGGALMLGIVCISLTL